MDNSNSKNNKTSKTFFEKDIDDTSKKRRPVHSVLLAQEIFIVEHLCNLEEVPSEGFSFTALPPKIKGMGTFPVRAIAKVKDA